MKAEALLRDADRYLSEHRPAECLIALSAALEVALATCLFSKLVRTPSAQKKAMPAEIQMLNKRYVAAIANLPPRNLCNVAMRMMTRHRRTDTPARALDAIEEMRRYANSVPNAEQIAAIEDAEIRAAVESLRVAAIIDLRNSAVHQMHEPTENDAREQRKSVGALIAAIEKAFG